MFRRLHTCRSSSRIPCTWWCRVRGGSAPGSGAGHRTGPCRRFRGRWAPSGRMPSPRGLACRRDTFGGPRKGNCRTLLAGGTPEDSIWSSTNDQWKNSNEFKKQHNQQLLLGRQFLWKRRLHSVHQHSTNQFFSLSTMKLETVHLFALVPSAGQHLAANPAAHEVPLMAAQLPLLCAAGAGELARQLARRAVSRMAHFGAGVAAGQAAAAQAATGEVLLAASAASRDLAAVAKSVDGPWARGAGPRVAQQHA